MFGMSFYQYVTSKDVIVKEEKCNLFNIANEKANIISFILDNEEKRLREFDELIMHDIMSGYFLGNDSGTNFTAEINKNLEYYKYYDNFSEAILLINATNGKVLFSTSPDDIGHYLRDILIFMPSGGNVSITPVFYSAIHEKPVTAVILNSSSSSHNFAYVSRINTTFMENILESSFTDQNWDAYMVNQFNTFVTPSRYSSEDYMNTWVRTVGVERALNHENGTDIYDNFNGMEVVGAYRWIPKLSVALLVEVPVEDSLSDFYNYQDAYVMAVILASIFVLVVATYLGNIVTRPLQILVDGTKRIADGDMNYRLNGRLSKGGYEFVNVASSFNEMTEKLGYNMSDLKKAKEEIEFYLDVLTHDVGNMNQSVLGYLELMNMEGNLSDKSMYLKMAEVSVKRIIHMVENVKAMSLIKSKERNFYPVNLTEIMEKAIETVRDIHITRYISLKSDLPADKTIMADEFIYNLFFNLFNNSVIHNKNSDVYIHVDMKEEDGYYRLEIEDNGEGILDSLKERIFKKFEIGRNAGTSSGIGLAIVRYCVERYLGKIWVEDRVEGDLSKGSIFVILLPKNLSVGSVAGVTK